MRLQGSHVVAGLVGAVLLAVWIRGFWFNDVFTTPGRNEPNRAALVLIRDGIQLGDSHSQVLAAYWRLRTDSLRLSAEGPGYWYISTPLEFGASNWGLVLEFRDGRIDAVRVRTADGPAPMLAEWS